MSQGKFSIFNLLRRENTSCSKEELLKQTPKFNPSLSAKETTHWHPELRMKQCDREFTAQKDIIVQIVADEVHKASKIVCWAWYRYFLRKQSKLKRFVADIYFEADHDIAENVQIVGEFSNPKWLIKIPMKYSFFHKAFKAKINIQDNCQFKFIIDGNFIWWSSYPMAYSSEKFTNNVFKLNKFKRYSESMIRKEIKNIKIDLNSTRDDYIRKKNSQILSLIANKNHREISNQWLNMK